MLLKLLLRPLLLLMVVCLVCLGMAVTMGQAAGGGVVALWAMTEYGGNYDIYLVDARTLVALNLTHDPRMNTRFAWSPDGTQLIYVEQRAATYTLRIVDLRGREIGHFPIPFAPTDLVWSPDGTQLTALSPDNDIYLGDPATGAWLNLSRTRGFAEGNVSWSPDGTQLAYTLDHGSVWVVDLATRQFHQLSDISQSSVPRWSPDGTRIVYTRWNGDVCVYDLRDHTRTVLSAAQNPRTPPLWSHDGVRLAFIAETDAGFVLRQIDITSRAATDFALPFEDVSSIAWSPDETVFVITAALKNPFYSKSLYTVDAAAGRVQRLTNGAVFAVYALWQPEKSF